MIAPAIDLLGLDSLSGTKMTFLTPKRMGIPPLDVRHKLCALSIVVHIKEVGV